MPTARRSAFANALSAEELRMRVLNRERGQCTRAQRRVHERNLRGDGKLVKHRVS